MDEDSIRRRHEAARQERAPGLLDQIYELLEGLEEEVVDIREAKRGYGQKVNVYQYPSIFDAISLLDEFHYSSRLGLNANDLGKFLAAAGTIDGSILPRLASRCISLLKELEGEVAADLPHPVDGTPSPSSEVTTDELEEDASSASRALEVKVEGWVAIHRQTNSNLIAQLSDLLGEVIILARNVNLPEDRQALSPLERAQLVTLLETALTMLKAPLVEKGLMRTLRSAATKGAETATTKGTELALGYMLKKVGELIIKLLDNLS